MKKNNIIYHNKDLDGFCSAAIVKKYLLSINIRTEDINLIGWNYGDPSPLPGLDGPVYLVDLSLPENDMIALKGDPDTIWIDHHSSAIEESYGKWHFINGSRMIGDSAAKLCWEFFFPRMPLPDIVYWVDRYDVWKKKDEDGTYDWEYVMHAQWGMRNILKDPVSDIAYHAWDYNMIQMDPRIFEEGKKMYDFIQDQNKIIAKRAFDFEFHGLKFCAVNAEGNSEVVKSVVRMDHDGIMMFRYNGPKDMWDVSLYGTSIGDQPHDLSNIAKMYGGGGHRLACGFSVKRIAEIMSI